MAFDSRAIANEILKVARDRGLKLTPLQLQKLTYFAHGWCLGLFGESLIDEQVEAWQYGPVINSIYNAFKKYGNDPITSRARRINFESSDFKSVPWDIDESDESNDKKKRARAVIGKVISVYGNKSGLELSAITHGRGTPWREVNDEYHGNIPKGTDIPRQSIEDYFKTVSGD